MAIDKAAMKRIGLALIAVVVLVLGWAWIDGGREPLRPIVERVEPPASLGENVR